MIDDQLKEQIRNAVDIVQIIGERVPLKKAGKAYLARCPFHTEKTPSFNVNPDLQIYKCFGCGVGGDVFSFLMAYDKISFPEALRALAERAGIPMTDTVSRKHQARREANDPYYQANALAREYFVDSLNDPKKGTSAREYLTQRGLTEETIHKFGLGYAPDSWDGLLALARIRNITPNILVESGLAVRNEKGRVYDRFRGRVTFPITNDSGRVVAFGARTLDPDGEPKYLNSSESPVYQKNRILYGLYHAREAIRREKTVFVVEGYMDVIRLMQDGIGNVVATCGTSLTAEHGRLLKRYSDRVVLIFDGDTAGGRAAVRAGDTLLEAGIESIVALLPAGEDPDTLVARDGPDALQKIADDGTPFVRFRWKRLGEEYDLRTVTGRNSAIGVILDVVALVEDELTRTLLASQVADFGAVDDALVMRAINIRRQRRTPRRDPDTSNRPPKPPKRWNPPIAEKELVARMVNRPWVCDMVRDVGTELFVDELARKIAHQMIDFVDIGESPSIDRLLDQHRDDPEWMNAVSELPRIECDEDDIEQAVSENIANIQLPHVRSAINNLRARLRDTLSPEEQRETLEQLQELTRESQRLIAIFGRSLK